MNLLAIQNMYEDLTNKFECNQHITPTKAEDLNNRLTEFEIEHGSNEWTIEAFALINTLTDTDPEQIDGIPVHENGVHLNDFLDSNGYPHIDEIDKTTEEGEELEQFVIAEFEDWLDNNALHAITENN